MKESGAPAAFPGTTNGRAGIRTRPGYDFRSVHGRTADWLNMHGLTRITVGISEMKVSQDANAFLITHSLGPCIGLVVYDTRMHAAGLLHLQLPESKGHERKAQENPAMFADTGIPLLLDKLYGLGAQKRDLQVSIFGGASMLTDDQIFKIGIKNARAAKKLLWQHCLMIKDEDTGGEASRTVSVEVGTGRIRVQKNGKVYEY